MLCFFNRVVCVVQFKELLVHSSTASARAKDVVRWQLLQLLASRCDPAHPENGRRQDTSQHAAAAANAADSADASATTAQHQQHQCTPLAAFVLDLLNG